jgi:hypothetical protein
MQISRRQRLYTMIRNHHERGELPPASERFRLVNHIAEMQIELRRAHRLLDAMDGVSEADRTPQRTRGGPTT